MRLDSARFGDVLSNGATIIQVRNKAAGEYVVLALHNGGFVTWAATMNGETFWGHYFGTRFNDAVDDLYTR